MRCKREDGINTLCAGIAQLVERDLAKVEVAGSNPVSRSIISTRLWPVQSRMRPQRFPAP